MADSSTDCLPVVVVVAVVEEVVALVEAFMVASCCLSQPVSVFACTTLGCVSETCCDRKFCCAFACSLELVSAMCALESFGSLSDVEAVDDEDDGLTDDLRQLLNESAPSTGCLAACNEVAEDDEDEELA